MRSTSQIPYLEKLSVKITTELLQAIVTQIIGEIAKDKSELL
jgi:hypothetical protein